MLQQDIEDDPFLSPVSDKTERREISRRESEKQPHSKSPTIVEKYTAVATKRHSTRDEDGGETDTSELYADGGTTADVHKVKFYYSILY